MPSPAQVTSVEALEDFRAALVLYLSKARPALEEVGEEVARTRIWLENDARLRWEAEVRRRAKALEQAQQALFSARLSNLREVTTAEQEAVHRARRALTEAETKLALVKRWNREFSNRAEPLARQLEKLRTVLFTDLPQAVAHLAQIVRTLDAYTDATPPAAAPETPPASGAPAEAAAAQPPTEAAG